MIALYLLDRTAYGAQGISNGSTCYACSTCFKWQMLEENPATLHN